MGGNGFMTVIGLVLVFPFIFFFLKVWLFATGTPGSTHHRVQRIAEMDGHLSFDERLAEKLRELEREKEEATGNPPATPPETRSTGSVGFGRRGL